VDCGQFTLLLFLLYREMLFHKQADALFHPTDSLMPLPVLFEDNHVLVVNKPAMLPTMGVAEGIPSVLSVAKDYIREKYNKPGNVYLGIVSRLDAPVTGVLLIARTSKAAARLTEQFRNHQVRKTYWTVVEGHPDPPQGERVNFMRKDERHRKMHVCQESAAGAKEAKLSYHTLRTSDDYALLQVNLHTGRKHQIRVQLASMGHPVAGDRKYRGEVTPRLNTGIALHSRQLIFHHPISKEELTFDAAPPVEWRNLAIKMPRKVE